MAAIACLASSIFIVTRAGFARLSTSPRHHFEDLQERFTTLYLSLVMIIIVIFFKLALHSYVQSKVKAKTTPANPSQLVE